MNNTLFPVIIAILTTFGWAETPPPRPAILDEGTICVAGTLVNDGTGILSEFAIKGINFLRTKENQTHPYTNSYRLKAILEDGEVCEAPLDVATPEGYEVDGTGQRKMFPWSAVLPTAKNIRKIQILQNDILLKEETASVDPFPYVPVITQTGKYQVRVQPIEVENLQCSMDGGESLMDYDRADDFPDGVFAFDQHWCHSDIAPIFMVDVIHGWNRYTAWLILDSNFVPPPTQ